MLETYRYLINNNKFMKKLSNIDLYFRFFIYVVMFTKKLKRNLGLLKKYFFLFLTNISFLAPSLVSGIYGTDVNLF